MMEIAKTHYFVQNKENNIILQTLKKLYETAEDTDTCTDIIFVSGEGIELKCHKLVLFWNDFFRDLFDTSEGSESIRIILPSYRHNTISILLRFFYTGKIILHSSY
jgi:hypothetical protein